MSRFSLLLMAGAVAFAPHVARAQVVVVRRTGYFAYSTARVSRMTVTLI